VSLISHARPLAVLCVAALVSACGGGGGGSNSTSTVPAATVGSTPPPIPPGPNSFLLFPNPQVQADGAVQTDTPEYAQAYYRAIDPNKQRTTLEDFKNVNGFNSGSFKVPPTTVLFDDTRDLGYARKITFWVNSDGTSAVFVTNYLAGGFASYQTGDPQVNLQAGAADDRRWVVETNAIEFSAAPAAPGAVNFTKFFVFNPNGDQQLFGTLDNRGPKSLPSVCVSCHGGRGDALTPPDASGLPRFPLVYNSASQLRGDTGAHMQPVEVGIQVFQPAGMTYARAVQEAALKKLNTQMVMCAYPVSAATRALNNPEDACRRTAIGTEWQGDTAAEIIRDAYGGPGLPNGTWNDTFIAGDWAANGQTNLYNDAIVNGCRLCHKLRGVGVESDIDFNTTEKFAGYGDRVFQHVYNRGNMPLAKLVFDTFWGSAGPRELAGFLQPLGFDAKTSSGAVLMPGRPIANPGPDRTVPLGASTLSADMSLYADSYNWSLVSNPGGGATLGATSGPTVTFNATLNGTYVVQLLASKGAARSSPAQLTIVVNSALPYVPTALRWVDIAKIVQNNGPLVGPTNCLSCHVHGGGPPIVYDPSFDRSGTGNPATNDLWLYTEVRGRVNFTDIIASPILRKPSNNHHFGGLQNGFDTSFPVGSMQRANYDQIVNWILNGAPYS
jgi:mono/diheme cytochrome c family protein